MYKTAIMIFLLTLALTSCPFLNESPDNKLTTKAGGGGSGTSGDAYEVDNTKAQASALSTVQYHTIHVDTDVDFIKFNVTQNKTYTLQISEIDGFIPWVCIYHQNDALPFLKVSQIIEPWNPVDFKSAVNETVYISVESLFDMTTGSYKIGYSESDTVLQVPSNFKATDGEFENKVVLTWNSTADADTYLVYKSKDGINFGTPLAETANLKYEDTASATNIMEAAFHYTYKVCGKINSGATSVFSTPDTGFIREFVVPDLSADINKGAIRLSWGLIANVTEYRIYRSVDPVNNFDLISTETGSPYNVTGSQPDVTYYFYYIPVKTGIIGIKSNTVSAIIPFSSFKPEAPNASDSIVNKIRITWKPVEGATGYKLFRSTAGEPLVQVGGDFSSSTLQYEDSPTSDLPITTGVYYDYCIKVIKGGQNSDYSYSDSGIAESL